MLYLYEIILKILARAVVPCEVVTIAFPYLKIKIKYLSVL